MAERYPGDGAATNGFGRRTLQAWEARMLYDADYMAPPDTWMPPGWKLSAGGIGIPPAPTPDELSYDVQEYIGGMENPAEAESADNLLYWEHFFAERHEQELARHEGPSNESPPKRNNLAGRRCWWSAPGRTLAAVLEHINRGNTPRLGFPRTPTLAARTGRRPPANWAPRRMASMSSSSSASASHSSGSAPLHAPTEVKREAESLVRSPPRTRSRNIVIGEPQTTASPTDHLRLRRPKIEGSVPAEDAALKMALEQSLRETAPQTPPPMEPSSPDIPEWSRKDWEQAERQRILGLQQQAARRRALSGRELAYQGAPLYVLDDDEDEGPSFQPWRCVDPGQGSSRQNQPPSDDDDGGEDDGRADPGYTAFYSNFGM